MSDWLGWIVAGYLMGVILWLIPELATRPTRREWVAYALWPASFLYYLVARWLRRRSVARRTDGWFRDE